MKKVIDLIDISKIRSKQLLEALDNFEKSSDGLFQIVLKDFEIEPELISELNQVLQETPNIEKLEMVSANTKIDGIDFSKISSNTLEKCFLSGFNIEDLDFSEQENLDELHLKNCQISDLSFLDNINNKFSSLYLSHIDLKETSIEEIFKLWLRLDKLDLKHCEGSFLNTDNIFLKEILSYSVNNFSEKFESSLPNEVKDFIKGTSQICLDDYLKLSKYLDFNDCVQRKIYIPDIEITEEYIEKINALNTNENLMITITPEQVKEFNDKLNNNLYIGINFENGDEASKYEDYPDNIKQIVINNSTITKEQLKKIMKKDKSIVAEDGVLHLEIKNASELSNDELDELSEKNNLDIVMNDENLSYAQEKPYSVAEYRICRAVIDELINGIEFGNENDLDREKKIFGQVIKRLANHMSYDYPAINDKEIEREIISRNMYGGLIDGKCVCAGYAEIVRNVFSCLGIDAIYVSGSEEAKENDAYYVVDGKKYKEGGHAWNQIKLDGVWYNMDLTWDRDKIFAGKEPQFLLKSDKDFYHDKYRPISHKSKTQDCLESIEQRKLNKYIFGKKDKNIVLSLKDSEETNDKNIITDTKSKLKSLWNKFSIGETDIKNAYKILVKTKEMLVPKNMDRNKANDDKDEK